MSLFFSLLSKLFPLYATMGAGAVLSRSGAGNLTSGLAFLQIYLIAPVIVFTSLLKLQMVPELAVMPFVWFGFVAAISTVTNFAARRLGSDYAPVLAQASGGANTGYLGAPIAMILFPADWLPVYFFIMLGGFFYESTLGYYWIARGRFTPRQALQSLLKLPTFYALLLGLAGNALGLRVPDMWQNIVRDFMGAYVVLGALIIGFAIAQNQRFVFNWRFLGTLYGIKFLLWPLLMLGLLHLLSVFLPDMPVAAHHCALLMSVMPLAANTAAFAALLKIHPEETATAVALSTLLSLVTVPVTVLLLGLAT